MAEQNMISESQISDFYDFYTDKYCNKLRRRTFAKVSPQEQIGPPPKKPHGLFVWRFLFYLLLLPTILLVGVTIPALQPVYQQASEMLQLPYLTEYKPADNEKDISGFLGKNIDFVESSLPVRIKSGGIYGYNVVDPGLYSSSSSLFRCLCDESGKIVQITLSDLGVSPYTIYGIEPKTDNTAANSLLTQNGYRMLADGYWVSRDYARVVLHEDYDWILRYTSGADEDIQLRALIDRDYKYCYSDSAGAYYLGNGQVLEYYHDSFAEFCYQYSKTTEFNRQSMAENADGRYILVPGEVIDVFGNGMVKVLCSDNEATQAAGKIWPMQGTADLTIRPEQSELLGKLKKDTEVVLFARLISSSYDGILGSEFSMQDGIILQIDGADQDIPIFDDAIPGIQHYHIENGSAVSDESTVISDAAPSAENPSINTKPTQQTRSEEELRTISLDSLNAVLNNQEPFYFCEQAEFRYLNQVDSAGELQFDYPLTPTHFTRVNMDQSSDGTVEFLMQMENEMNCWRLVLYYNPELGYVQGYIFPFRGMNMVMIDGTISASSSASESRQYRLKFNNDWYEEVPVEERWDMDLVYWIEIS